MIKVIKKNSTHNSAIHPRPKEVMVFLHYKDKKVECDLSQYMSTRTNSIRDFGCSDCDCESHLYYFKNRKEAIEHVKRAYDSIAMPYKYFRI